MGWGWGAIAFLFGLLMIAGIVVLVIVAVRMLRGGGGGGAMQWQGGANRYPQGGPMQGGVMPGGLSGARQILDERFARGEIGAEEYQERRRFMDG